MGVVYEARDRASGGRVAVKTLRELDAEALFRLKNEFRALRDLEHENLVRLHELVEEDGRWFLVMDFVDGVDVIEHHRLGHVARAAARTVRVSMEALSADDQTASMPGAEPDLRAVAIDYGEVRRVIAQLAGGLDALAQAGRVHRDIKPSNVMVARDGRVVILDFGLVADHRETPLSAEGALVGTVPYMAPEQAAGRRVGAEADCYGLGVLLFELLTARWPHEGSPTEILAAKQTQPAPHAKEIVPETPDDLDALCAELLAIEPTARPTAADVVRRLDRRAPTAPPRGSGPIPIASPVPSRFVGRKDELRALDEAFAASRDDAQVVWLCGASGIGKSALVRRFVERVRLAHVDAVVLASRCYQREVVPFKAVDGVIDALSAFLRGIDAAAAAELLPRHGAALTELFPVLARVPAIAGAPAARRAIRDPQERRMRAFAALRELFARLAERHPVVIVIDDLQWGDADSAQLLHDVLRAPEAPEVLVVLSSRDDPAARELVDVLGRGGRTPARIALGALDPSAAAELARHLLEQVGTDAITPEAIGAEANGHPLYIQELVRHAGEHGHSATTPRLDDAIWQRIEAMPIPARDVLGLVALAGARITMQQLGAAAELPPPDLAEVVSLLAAAALCRATGRRAADTVEPFHDRVSETVRAHLDPGALIDQHRRLAFALEGASGARPELLALHFRESGYRAKAAQYAERAAREAADQLAFGRSADLYREALAQGDRDPREARVIRILVAESLARAGRLREAADAFEQAADGADREVAFSLRCRALEQLLRSGQLERGLELGAVVLEGVGARVPKTARAATFGAIARRAWLRVRGRGFTARGPGDVPAGELTAIDVLWSAATGLAFADPILGRAMQVRYLLRALKAGDVRRIALASASDIGYVGLAGTRARRATEEISARAVAFAAESGDAHAIGLTASSVGLGRFLRGEFAEALIDFDEGISILRERTSGTRWEIDITELYRLAALVYLGRIDQAARDVSRLASEALQHGDEYLAIGVQAWRAGLVWLAQGRSAELRQSIDAARLITNPRGEVFALPDYHYLVALVHADLYDGRADAAWQRLLDAWPRLESSYLLSSVQILAIEARFLRLRTAIAAWPSATAAVKARLVADARAQARRIDRTGAPWAAALARLGRAMITAVEEGPAAGADALLAATPALDDALLRFYVMAATCRARALRGVRQDEELRALGVVDPAALCRVLVPV